MRNPKTLSILIQYTWNVNIIGQWNRLMFFLWIYENIFSIRCRIWTTITWWSDPQSTRSSSNFSNFNHLINEMKRNATSENLNSCAAFLTVLGRKKKISPSSLMKMVFDQKLFIFPFRLLRIQKKKTYLYTKVAAFTIIGELAIKVKCGKTTHKRNFFIENTIQMCLSLFEFQNIFRLQQTTAKWNKMKNWKLEAENRVA